MVAIVFFLELCERLVYREAQTLGKRFHVGPQLREQLILAYATDSRVLVVHGDIEQVVELAEDAKLSELRDARYEDKLEVWVKRLDGRIEVLHDAAQRGEVLVLVHHVEQRRVIFIDYEHHLLPCLFISGLDKMLEALVQVWRVAATTVFVFILN